jgi:hypothetical protein
MLIKPSIHQLFLLLTVLLILCNAMMLAQEPTAWKPLRSPLPRLSSIVANSTGTVIVAGESGAFISLNTGATWTALNNFPPGRLIISASRDFYVVGAAVWRFNNALQRFEQLALTNRSLPNFQQSLGFITHLTTSSSGSILLLAVDGKGLVRLSATTIATAIVSIATITNSTITGLTTNPRTGEIFAAWNTTLWQSQDNGNTWKTMTNATFLPTTRHLLFGRTRLLQSGGSVSPVCSDDYPLFCTDAMWERDDYMLLATPQGIVVQRANDTTPIFTRREKLTFLPDTPFERGLRVRQFAESGKTMFAITEQGIFCADEISIEKANPFLALPQKYLRWRECNLGLAGVVERVNIAQGTVITRSGWILRDSNAIPSISLWKNIAQDSLQIMAHIQTPDSALLAVSFRTEMQGILRSTDFGNTWTNAMFTLPRGFVWLTDPKSIQQPRALQQMLRTSSNALVMFAQDTLVSRVAPTLVVESRDNGRTWQSTEIRGLADNIALGNILASPRGFLFGEDRIFARTTLYRSQDNGKTWQTLSIGRVPEALSIHPTTGTLTITGVPAIFSTDNGASWQEARGLPFRSSGRFEGASELAFGTNTTLILNIRNLGIFSSNTSGENFQASSPRISTAYTVKAAPNGTFYALTQNAVWASSDGGNTWQTRNNGLSGLTSDLVLNDITFDAASTAYLSTSRGIYRLDSPRPAFEKNTAYITEQLTAQKTAAEEVFSGEQVLRIAPNPASQAAFATFTVTQPEFCRLEILSMRGEVVQVLLHDNLVPSVYRIALPLQNLPQGQYLCRLQYGSSTNTQFFTVIR